MIRKSFLSAVILVTAFCFTACGKPQTTNEIVTTSTTDTQVQTTPDALSSTEVEVTEQEVVAEPTTAVEEVIEAEPKEEKMSIEKWTKEINSEYSDKDLVFSMYNTKKNIGTFLNLNEETNFAQMVCFTGEYNLEDGDVLIINFPKGSSGFTFADMYGLTMKEFNEEYYTYDVEKGEVIFFMSYDNNDYKLDITIN